MAAWLPRLPATYEPLTGEKQYRRLAKLNVYSIQRTSKQRGEELIYMFYHSNDRMRAPPTPPTVLCAFTFLCNVDTLHVCIYKLCCSCMFFMISSALGGGGIAKHNSILFEFPSSVDPAFKFAASTVQKLIMDKMEFPVFLFFLSFFFFKCHDWIDAFIQQCANSHSCFCPRPSKITGTYYLPHCPRNQWSASN